MKHLFRNWRGLAGGIAITATTLAATAAEPQVKTLGGGPNQLSPARSGSANGETFSIAKFNNPNALALDTNGNLLVADKSNNKIRRVGSPGSPGSLTSTFVSRMPSPVGVAVDASNNVYVVTFSDGRLRVFNSGGSLQRVVGGLLKPTALALDADGNAYVTELGGSVKQIAPDDTVTIIAGGFLKPQGITVMRNGLLAVSDTGNHAVYSVDPLDGTAVLLAGNNGAGFNDGPGGGAQFNKPYGLATAPNGSIVVADRKNHRVRVITTNNMVSTLYGVNKSQWFRPFPGWVDGVGGVDGEAAAQDPIGVTVAGNGTVFTTEIAWDLLRQVTDTGLGLTNVVSPTNGTTNGPITLPTPTFGPNSGYYPFGVTVTVTSTVPVFYSTDGNEPTTNSLQVQLVDGIGTLVFAETQRDLRSLRLKAITSEGSSPTVGGVASPVNQMGIPRDFVAGSGANIMVPVVCNLRRDSRVQSFQYRVEITPENGGPPILPYMDATSILTNDFIPLVTSAAQNKVATYSVSPYTIGNTLGLVVTASGTNANVDFTDFAATALLRVPIDPGAVSGHSYRIEVLYPSATSNGYQGDITMAAGPARRITIASRPWLVGDTAPGIGYNGGEFGNGNLVNSDVNSVLYASVGLRVPFVFTDAFNAMNAWPPEPEGSPFGDVNGIEYADTQVVLARSLRLDPDNWMRFWLDGGIIDFTSASLPGDRPKSTGAPKNTPVPAPGDVWTRGATLSAGNLYNTPQGIVEVPIMVKVATNTSVAGMCFRVIVDAENGSALPQDVTFVPYVGHGAFQTLPGGAVNDVVCSWTMVPSPAFHLTGNSFIGVVRFRIPDHATPGHHYTVRFVKPSGAESMDASVSFDSVPGSVWVNWNPSAPAQTTADEWRAHFFSPTNSAAAVQTADPDNDGVSNAQEYTEGTNPTDANSYLRLERTDDGNATTLSWLSAPKKVYVVESASSVSGPWTVVSGGIVGDGYVKQVNAPPPSAPFYRIRVQP